MSQKLSQLRGLPPGTPIYIGEPPQADSAYSYVRYDQSEVEVSEFTTAEEVKSYYQVGKTNWVTAQGIHKAQEIAEICQFFVARGPSCSHFQPVGPNRIQRAEQSVKTGKDADMALGEPQSLIIEAMRLKATVNISVIRKNCRTLGLFKKLAVTVPVQLDQIV